MRILKKIPSNPINISNTIGITYFHVSMIFISDYHNNCVIINLSISESTWGSGCLSAKAKAHRGFLSVPLPAVPAVPAVPAPPGVGLLGGRSACGLRGHWGLVAPGGASA